MAHCNCCEFLLWYSLCDKIMLTGCFNNVLVQKRGYFSIIHPSLSVIPRANFTCNGRITGVIVSMKRLDNGTNDPYLQVWHRRTLDSDVFDKVGEVQLVESEVVEEVDNNNNTYWLVNITLSNDDRIEFEAGDVVGLYHPPDSHFEVWTVQTEGYITYGNKTNISVNTINLGVIDGTFMNTHPLVKLTIGKYKI